MKILLCGGKTGGHVYPAVAVAEQVVASDASAEVAFVGMAESFESRVAAQYGWRFIAMRAAPLKGAGVMQQVRNLFTVVHALWQALCIVRRERPDCVIGTGGFVSGPFMLMAALLRVPSVIHEQNSVPGLTNRLLGRVVQRVCITYPYSKQYFPEQKVVQTGLPLRTHVQQTCATRAVKDDNTAVVLVMGGSQGARRINAVVSEMSATWPQVECPIRVIHLAGRDADLAALRAGYATAGVSAEVSAFSEDMGAVYAQTDIAICRSGASSVAELAMAGVPAIFVPFPFAADDHQRTNAQAMVDAGAAVLIDESNLDVATLKAELRSVLQDAERLAQMQEHMRNLATPHAGQAVVQASMALVRKTIGVQHV